MSSKASLFDDPLDFSSAPSSSKPTSTKPTSSKPTAPKPSSLSSSSSSSLSSNNSLFGDEDESSSDSLFGGNTSKPSLSSKPSLATSTKPSAPKPSSSSASSSSNILLDLDDPLGLSTAGAGRNADEELVLPGQDDSTVFRSIDSSKINLKTKKEKVEKSVVATNSSNFITKDDFWGANASSTKNVVVDDDKLFDDPFLSKTSNDGGGLFGSNDKASKMINANKDLFEGAPPATKVPPSLASMMSNNGGRGANVGSQAHKDDQLSDLKLQISNEDDLDFETFGKSNVSAGAAVKVQETKKSNILSELQDDDFDIKRSFNQLKALETATVEKKSTTPVVVSTKHTSSSSETAAEVEVDMANLDINSYINDNQNEGGGLFD